MECTGQSTGSGRNFAAIFARQRPPLAQRQRWRQGIPKGDYTDKPLADRSDKIDLLFREVLRPATSLRGVCVVALTVAARVCTHFACRGGGESGGQRPGAGGRDDLGWSIRMSRERREASSCLRMCWGLRWSPRPVLRTDGRAGVSLQPASFRSSRTGFRIQFLPCCLGAADVNGVNARYEKAEYYRRMADHCNDERTGATRAAKKRHSV
jgi:hypothetical protein